MNDPEMLMTEDVEQKFDGQWMHGDANDILQVVVGQLDEARREIKRLNNLRVLLLERNTMVNIYCMVLLIFAVLAIMLVAGVWLTSEGVVW